MPSAMPTDPTPDAFSRSPEPAATQAVDEAIRSRRSIRAFLPTPVPRATVEELLALAARAPSGSNTQPWQVHVLSGASLARVGRAVLAVHDDPQQQAEHTEEYAYYPRRWVAPYVDRRRKIGWDLYTMLGIAKGDKARMHAQHGRNYVFFDAPVGLVFTIDRVMEQGSWLDYGMFLQTLMIAARARGLDTCPQAAFTPFHRIFKHELGLPDEAMLVCCMALGHADPDAIENGLQTEREPVAGFARFLD
jgi:nitroreductase